jgi:hypothetical protein
MREIYEVIIACESMAAELVAGLRARNQSERLETLNDSMGFRFAERQSPCLGQAICWISSTAGSRLRILSHCTDRSNNHGSIASCPDALPQTAANPTKSIEEPQHIIDAIRKGLPLEAHNHARAYWAHARDRLLPPLERFGIKHLLTKSALLKLSRRVGHISSFGYQIRALTDSGHPWIDGRKNPHAENALFAIRSGLVFLTVHKDADFPRAALDAGGLGYVVKARLASDLLRETSRLARGQSIVITQRAHSAAPSHQSAACRPSADARRRTQSTRRPPPERPYSAVRAAPSACLAPRPEEQRWRIGRD